MSTSICPVDESLGLPAGRNFLTGLLVVLLQHVPGTETVTDG